MVDQIACIGAGYVGITTCAVIAKYCSGIKITVCDINKEKIDSINAGKLPFFEPGLDELVNQRLNDNLFFTSDINYAVNFGHIIFICVNTPTKDNYSGMTGASDLSYYELAARSIADFAIKSKIIVEKSTVPVKTADMLSQVLLANCKSEVKFTILSNPEFLAEGSAIKNFENPDRVLIGGPQTEEGMNAMERLLTVYEQWVPKERIILMNVWNSELIKIASNAFLAQRLSSINSLSAICEKLGGDVVEIMKGIGTDSRIGMNYLMPSLGFGGSCLKKDLMSLVYMCESLHLHEVADYWRQVIIMNEYQYKRFSETIIKTLFNTVRAKNIAILGFSFKKGTSDTRESAAIYVCKHLVQERATLHIYDPKVPSQQITFDITNDCQNYTDQVKVFENPYSALENCHAMVICTDWDIFKELDYQKIFDSMLKPAFVFDGRLILDHILLEAIGFKVYSIGRTLQPFN